MRTIDFDLYLVTDRNTTAGRELLWVLEEALEGGVRAVQLREKDLEARALLELARRVNALCHRYGAELFVNDRVDVALAADAAGVHLAANSLPVKVARELLGPDRKMGVSTHSVEEARAAAGAGADLIVFGPVYPTPSKLAFGAPQGPAALKAVTDATFVPVFAIGGVKQQHLPEIKAHGTARIALISAIAEAPDPRTAARDMLAALRA
ncbi:MAG: thiamine phosphate synthase [Deltaproteobacteria bacterium]|nr:thiamine phosphate synthase [Deltaproteobacteria bacterium]